MNQPNPAESLATLMGMMMLLPMLMCGGLVIAQGFWIWMVVDCATNRRLVGNEKTVWIIVVVLMNWIGALVYFFAVRCRCSRGVPTPVPEAQGGQSPSRPPPRLPVEQALSPSVAGRQSLPITCPGCGKTAALREFQVDGRNKGECPSCGVHVQFE